MARPSSTGRPGASPCQNGSLPGWPGAGETSTRSWVMSSIRQDDDAEQEHVADPRLVDHLLVELAHPAAAAAAVALPPARNTPNRPRSGIVPPLVTASRWAPGRPVQLAGDAVPDQPGPQLGERVGRVAAGQHVEHGLERRAGQPGERRGAAHQLLQLVDVPVVHGHHRDDLLGQHVERVARRCASPRSRRRASARPRRRTGPGRRGTWGRSRRGTRRRPGGRPARPAAARWPPTAATRPGPPGRPRPCRCRAPGCEVATTAGSRPAFSASSIRARCSRDTEPWWARATSTGAAARAPAPDSAISSAGGRASARRAPCLGPLGGELVEPGGQSRSASRRELANTIVDCAPRRGRARAPRRAARWSARSRRPPPGRRPRRARRVGDLQVGHVLDRHHDLQLDPLARRRAATIVTGRRAAEEAWPPRRPAAPWPTARSAGPARSSKRVQPLQARGPGGRRAWCRQTACTSSTITVSTPRSASRAWRGEQQEQRLGRGDQDVGRRARPTGGARRPGCRRSASPTVMSGSGRPSRARGLADAGQRRAQVALDVDRQRLQRADVEHPAALPRVGRRPARVASRSSAHRNAASVLPDPVGATTSVCSPPAIAAHARAWAGVGAAKAAANQARVASLKPSRRLGPGRRERRHEPILPRPADSSRRRWHRRGHRRGAPGVGHRRAVQSPPAGTVTPTVRPPTFPPRREPRRRPRPRGRRCTERAGSRRSRPGARPPGR